MKNNYIRSVSMVLINVLILFVFMIFFKKYMNPLNIVQWSILAIFGSVIQTITIVLFYKYVDKKSFNSLRIKMNKKDVLFSIFSVLLTVGMVFFYLNSASQANNFAIEWNLDVFKNISFYLLLLLAAFAWFNAALTEEVLFRWYLVTNLSNLSTGKLYFVTSLLFMLSHVFKGFDPFYILFLLTTSCSLLYVYLRSGRKLLPVTFAHMAQNLTLEHLIGKSDIAILKFNTEPSIVHLMVLFILYNVLIIGLSTIMYKNEGEQINISNSSVLVKN